MSIRHAAWAATIGGERRDVARYARSRRSPIDISVAGITATVRPTSYSEWVTVDHFNERSQLEAVLSEIGPDDVFWDVGAHVGLYALLCGQVARGTVCFEPDPVLRRVLRKNLRDNGLDARVKRTALGGESGTATIMENHRWRSAPFEAVVRRGDELGLPPPDVVKIDVEGFEYDVVRGLSGLLDGVEMLLIEVHPHKFVGGEWNEMNAWLLDRGFNVGLVGEREQVFHVSARQKR